MHKVKLGERRQINAPSDCSDNSHSLKSPGLKTSTDTYERNQKVLGPYIHFKKVNLQQLTCLSTKIWTYFNLQDAREFLFMDHSKLEKKTMDTSQAPEKCAKSSHVSFREQNNRIFYFRFRNFLELRVGNGSVYDRTRPNGRKVEKIQMPHSDTEGKD